MSVFSTFLAIVIQLLWLHNRISYMGGGKSGAQLATQKLNYIPLTLFIFHLIICHI